MSLPATDTFTGTDGAGIGANWTSPAGGMVFASNKAAAQQAAANWAYWNVDAFGNDQYSQAKVYANAGVLQCGLLVRANGTPRGYLAQVDSTSQITIHDASAANTFSALQTITGLSIADGDVIKLEVSGTTLRVYQNGVQRGSNQATGGAYSSGSAGILAYDIASGRLDDWEGGNVAASSQKGLLTLGVGGLAACLAPISPAIWRWRRMNDPVFLAARRRRSR